VSQLLLLAIAAGRVVMLEDMVEGAMLMMLNNRDKGMMEERLLTEQRLQFQRDQASSCYRSMNNFFHV